MKVIRQITYEGTEEQLEVQLKHSAPNGVWKLPTGLLRSLTMRIETLEEPDSAKVHQAIDYHPEQWPVRYEEPQS